MGENHERTELHYTVDIQNGEYNTPSECIGHIGLLASAITHSAMAPLTLSRALYSRLSTPMLSFYSLSTLTSHIALSVFLRICFMGYLQMYPLLRIITIIVTTIIIQPLNNQLSIFNSSIVGFLLVVDCRFLRLRIVKSSH